MFAQQAALAAYARAWPCVFDEADLPYRPPTASSAFSRTPLAGRAAASMPRMGMAEGGPESTGASMPARPAQAIPRLLALYNSTGGEEAL